MEKGVSQQAKYYTRLEYTFVQLYAGDSIYW